VLLNLARNSSVALLDKIVNMNNEYSVKDKLTLLLLATGMVSFGLIFPDSISDHVKIVHLAAHFGMSFLLALCFFMVCTIKMRISRAFSYTVLITATLLIGVVYKLVEIATQGQVGTIPLQTILDQAGVMTSMSENLSGLMAAMLIIEGLLVKNLVMTVARATKTISESHRFSRIGTEN
jgi:hypothetical protein